MEGNKDNIRLVIEYDGSGYHGWQKQLHDETIQGTIETVFFNLFKEEISLQGASRTDAGVHAKAQVANFFLKKDISPQKIMSALNAKLPRDIVVLEVENVPNDFNARFGAKGKYYRYVIFNGEFRSPFENDYSLFFPGSLDIAKMQEGADFLIGTFDFASFGVNPKREIASTIRTITSIDVIREKEKIYIDVYGDSFLYKMVRSIVGTLLEVGSGRRKPAEVKEILDRKDRCCADKTAEPQGLYLMKVFY